MRVFGKVIQTNKIYLDIVFFIIENLLDMDQ